MFRGERRGRVFRLGGMKWRQELACAAALLAASSVLWGCGQGAPGGGDPSPGQSGVAYSVTGPCAVSGTEQRDFVPLTKAEFVELLATYTVDWFAPLHSAMASVKDEQILRAFFEVIWGVYDKNCRSTADYNILRPSDSLLDPAEQEEARREMIDFVNNAVEVTSGDVLRLSFHQCEACTEPVGETPSFWNVRRTQDGTLLVEVELTEGTAWTKKVTIRPNEVTLQVELEPGSDWLGRVGDKQRSGVTTYPELSGTLTLGVGRDELGHTRALYSVSNFGVVSKPGAPDEVRLSSRSGCVGVEALLGPSDEASTLQADLGNFDLKMPRKGVQICGDGATCEPIAVEGTAETSLAAVSLDLVQPPSTSPEVFSLNASTDRESTLTIDGDLIARGGLGKSGQGGQSLASVRETSEGFLVTFSPALDLGAALTISSLSEALRMDLPTWLSDEVFDLSFGGDPVPSVLVPFREACPEGQSTSVSRREAQVMSGELDIAVGGGSLHASPNQCFGWSLEDSATFDQVSDFWDVGFACTE
jgi:hypothetical protein